MSSLFHSFPFNLERRKGSLLNETNDKVLKKDLFLQKREASAIFQKIIKINKINCESNVKSILKREEKKQSKSKKILRKTILLFLLIYCIFRENC